MPSQLFVDSSTDEENGNMSEGGSEDEGDFKSEDDDNGVGGNNSVDENQKGTKRKANQKKSKVSKKAKKLGPKVAKGENRSEVLTREEIKELTAKEYAQYSNLYNVQIEEVLRETRISEKKKTEVENWVQEFTKFVQGMKKKKPCLVQDYEKFLKPVKLPLPKHLHPGEKSPLTEQSIQWLPPSAVEIRGSWALDTAINKISSVDVFVEMAYDYLLKSDNLNHKYHVKRAIYLGYIAKCLRKRGDVVKFTNTCGGVLKPVITVEVNKIQILIHAVPPKDYFKMQKLACDKNNLRYEHFFHKSKSDDEPEASTQHYNFTIVEDALASETHDECTKFLSKGSKVEDAVKLIKIWLTQRDLAKGYGSFSGVIITQFFRYLSKVGKISGNMMVFQLVRVFFISLIQTNLYEHGISFGSDTDLKLAHLQWDIVFLNSTGILNYTANLSKYTFKRIQQEAKHALSIIDKGNVTGFLALFITRVKFMLNFDHILRIKKIDELTSKLEKKEHEPTLLNHSGFVYPLAVSTLGSLIETCLGQRITIVDTELPQLPVWDLENYVPKHIPSTLRFGLVINREVSQKLVVKCESESDAEVEQFKQFWGAKSELRRFMDGTLLESVSLENIAGLGKSRICYQMLKYIFKFHIGYKLSSWEYLDKQMETSVENKYACVKSSITTPQRSKKAKRGKYLNGKQVKNKQIVNEVLTSTTVDEVTRSASHSFDELSKALRLLGDLPLAISTVQGSSAVLRFTHVQPTPPQTYSSSSQCSEVDPAKSTMLVKESGDNPDAEIVRRLPKYVEPIGVIIHLESSGQWPDDIKAIQKLKCAFLLKIGQLLGKKLDLCTHAYPNYLDVLKDGFIFRIRLTYFRELILLRQLRDVDGVQKLRDNPDSLRLEKEALILPQLTSTLHSFHLQYEAFGKTCRIAKRWIASQLLLCSPLQHNRKDEQDSRISEEAVELLVAYMFLNYAPYLSYPSEAHVGFQRFLALLANTDFRAVPLVLNFNDKLSSQEMVEIELEFVKLRPTLPPLFIATPFDPKGSVWTRHLSQVMLTRAQLLAKQALIVMENYFENIEIDNSQLLNIYKPSITQFDVMIKLKEAMNPRFYQSMNSIGKAYRFKPYSKITKEVLPVMDFDPVQMYLQDLRNAFGHMAVFLHDLYGGQAIAVVWKPEFFKTQKFSNEAVRGRQPGKLGESIVANVSGILENFQIMGDGLVDQVETQCARWKFQE